MLFLILIFICFLEKFLSQYNLGYTQFGTSKIESAFDIALDSNNNIYMVGNTNGSFPGYTYQGSWDAWIIKYDNSSNFQWVRQSGTTQSDTFNKVKVDKEGNIIVFGLTCGSFPEFTLIGVCDLLLVKYDQSGNLIWLKQYGTDQYETAESLALDSDGGIYLTGLTYGKFTSENNKGGSDIYVLNFDSSGSLIWSFQIGTTLDDVGKSITVDSSKDVYITGATKGSLETNVANQGGNDFLSQNLETQVH